MRALRRAVTGATALLLLLGLLGFTGVGVQGQSIPTAAANLMKQVCPSVSRECVVVGFGWVRVFVGIFWLTDGVV